MSFPQLNCCPSADNREIIGGLQMLHCMCCLVLSRKKTVRFFTVFFLLFISYLIAVVVVSLCSFVTQAYLKDI